MGRRRRSRERKVLVKLAKMKALQIAEKFARKLQRKEIARRLGDLNHEAARIKAAADSSVSRELFDAKITEIDRWQGNAAQRMAAWSGGGAVVAYIVYWLLHK